VGWYRREFDIAASDAGRRISIEFDGAFRSVVIFVNGCFIGRNDNGYAPFQFDVTDFLEYGAKNYIVARVDASLEMAGSTREPVSTGTCGSPRPTRCTWANGRVMCVRLSATARLC